MVFFLHRNAQIERSDEGVYFAEVVHPEYKVKPAFAWVKAGSNPAVCTTAGRGRLNIHGALNLEFDAPFVDPTTVDGVRAVQFLTKIEARNPDKRIFHVIWDNAADLKGPDTTAAPRLPSPQSDGTSLGGLESIGHPQSIPPKSETVRRRHFCIHA